MARYIDADALIEHLREYKTVYGVPMTDSDKQVVHCIIGHIKNLEPTAYDVKAVVEELKKIRDDENCDSVKMADCLNCMDCSLCLMNRAISIVRGKE